MLVVLSLRKHGGELTARSITTKHLSALHQVVYGAIDLCNANMSAVIVQLILLPGLRRVATYPTGMCVERTLELLRESGGLVAVARDSRAGACSSNVSLSCPMGLCVLDGINSPERAGGGGGVWWSQLGCPEPAPPSHCDSP